MADTISVPHDTEVLDSTLEDTERGSRRNYPMPYGFHGQSRVWWPTPVNLDKEA